MTKKAVILAAGLGSRLVSRKDLPKPLQPVGGVPLIVRTLRKLEALGLEDVAVIVGYRGELLGEVLQFYRFDFKLHIIFNDEWEKPNGTSLLKAKDFVDGPSFVLMSDHLCSLSLLQRVDVFPVGTDEAVLGVDFDIPRCFDLPDATKVALRGGKIVEIGKELPSYEALDTGVFKITPALMDALDNVNGPKGCSLSEGIAALAAKGKMRAVDIGRAPWVDVDTPEARDFAEANLACYESVEADLPLQQPVPSVPSRLSA
ncbi:MAG: NTP transferase domain-containing protein [Myxococcales bacterium]|nr:MAG: NTP transferase domain-containing protein [Myxococcales bacterium]